MKDYIKFDLTKVLQNEDLINTSQPSQRYSARYTKYIETESGTVTGTGRGHYYGDSSLFYKPQSKLQQQLVDPEYLNPNYR